jgi:hypothetical protein
MSLVISKVFTYDTDAGDYIQAVEAADGQALEAGTRQAINNFVIGCKQDGIWSAIKASCILSGARTLTGALVPLVGTAPTNNNFVSGDYNRKTGLVGNGSTKYLNSNRNNNADPQNNQHLAFYASSGSTVGGRYYIGSFAGTGVAGTSFISVGNVSSRNQADIKKSGNSSSSNALFSAITRNSNVSFFHRSFDTTVNLTGNSAIPHDANISVFTAGTNAANGVAARLAFYSIGESIDLALLDARVTALITAFGVAIP